MSAEWQPTYGSWALPPSRALLLKLFIHQRPQLASVEDAAICTKQSPSDRTAKLIETTKARRLWDRRCARILFSQQTLM